MRHTRHRAGLRALVAVAAVATGLTLGATTALAIDQSQDVTPQTINVCPLSDPNGPGCLVTVAYTSAIVDARPYRITSTVTYGNGTSGSIWVMAQLYCTIDGQPITTSSGDDVAEYTNLLTTNVTFNPAWVVEPQIQGGLLRCYFRARGTMGSPNHDHFDVISGRMHLLGPVLSGSETLFEPVPNTPDNTIHLNASNPQHDLNVQNQTLDQSATTLSVYATAYVSTYLGQSGANTKFSYQVLIRQYPYNNGAYCGTNWDTAVTTKTIDRATHHWSQEVTKGLTLRGAPCDKEVKVVLRLKWISGNDLQVSGGDTTRIAISAQ